MIRTLNNAKGNIEHTNNYVRLWIVKIIIAVYIEKLEMMIMNGNAAGPVLVWELWCCIIVGTFGSKDADSWLAIIRHNYQWWMLWHQWQILNVFFLLSIPYFLQVTNGRADNPLPVYTAHVQRVQYRQHKARFISTIWLVFSLPSLFVQQSHSCQQE